MSTPEFDDYLSAPNLINIARNFFINIKDPRKCPSRGFDLMSFLISGLAIFFLKCDSLLAYCESNEIVTGNIKKVFGTLSISSDTHFRTVVDKIETNSLKGLFKEYFFLLKIYTLSRVEKILIFNDKH